ncbi:MAG: hypothetical protein H0X62_04980 [Bacteroidetes bacterium]|nr:hypothetical protein [Bacteroidota bacterium]
MPLTYILIAVMAVIVLFAVFFSKSKSKPENTKAELDEETDGLIFDHETGKYVTVEELVEKHQLDVIDDAKIQQVYEALSPETQEELALKEVAAIMESHYQFKAFEPETEEKPEEEYILQVIYDGFQKKGKDISMLSISAVIKTYDSISSPAK